MSLPEQVPKFIDELVDQTIASMPQNDLNSLWTQLHPEEKQGPKAELKAQDEPKFDTKSKKNVPHHVKKFIHCKPQKRKCKKKCCKPCCKPRCPKPCPPPPCPGPCKFLPSCVVPICPLPMFQSESTLRDPHYITEYERPLEQSLFMPWHLMVASDQVIIFRTNPQLPGTSGGVSQILVQLPSKPRFGVIYKIGIIHSDPEHKSAGQAHIVRGDAAMYPFWKTIKSRDDGSFLDSQFLLVIAYQTEQGLISWSSISDPTETKV